MSSTYTTSEWAKVCEAVDELDEPPVRSCPQCRALCYEVPAGVYHCSRCGEHKAAV